MDTKPVHLFWTAVRLPRMGWKTERLTKHPQKVSEGWLLNDEQQVICRFSNDLPSAHAKWIRVETRPFRGGRATVRRMLRQNAIAPGPTCSRPGGSVAHRAGDAAEPLRASFSKYSLEMQ